MNRLSNGEKKLAYHKISSPIGEYEYYNVIKETKTKYIIEGNIHVSKLTGRELTPLSRNKYVVNFGKYLNGDGSTNYMRMEKNYENNQRD